MASRSFSNAFSNAFGGPQNVGSLAIKVGTVGSDPSYQDGDILDAFNRKRTRCVHAQHICHPWANGVNASGLRVLGSHVEQFYSLTHQYKFERLGVQLVRRTRLTDSTSAEFGGATPDPEGGFMDVDLFVQRRRSELAPDGGPRFAIFGTPGTEVWYGGKVDVSNTKLDAIWSMIETATPHREVNFPQWPFGTDDLKHHLCIVVNDFDDATGDELKSPVLDLTDPDNPIMLKARKYAVAWRQLRDVIEGDVLNPNVSVDIRSRKHVRNEIVTLKV